MFALSEETPFIIKSKGIIGKQPGKLVAWRELHHISPVRTAFVIQCFNTAVIESINIGNDDCLYLQYGAGLKKISDDGLDISVSFHSLEGGESQEIFSDHVENGNDSFWNEVSVSLVKIAGKKGSIEIFCGPGPDKNPAADWLAVLELHICTQAQLTLSKARMHTERRAENEKAHFSAVYRLPMFNKHKINAFSFAQQLVRQRVLKKPINYKMRMMEKAKYKKLRVLSLCSGSANLEASLIKGIEDRIDLTLFDINADLLHCAASKFTDLLGINTICGNANEIELPSNAYDIVICVSALHHIVELEYLTESICDCLVPGGEFWNIGEYVDYEGARLWPESYDAANKIFRSLPERLRINHVRYGKAAVDDNLPNPDCSLNTFEGIRSTEILPVLSTRFKAVQIDRWSTIIWRILGPAYVPNYNIESEKDRSIVEKIVAKDIEYFLSGKLKPVGMNAIFLPCK